MSRYEYRLCDADTLLPAPHTGYTKQQHGAPARFTIVMPPLQFCFYASAKYNKMNDYIDVRCFGTAYYSRATIFATPRRASYMPQMHKGFPAPQMTGFISLAVLLLSSRKSAL